MIHLSSKHLSQKHHVLTCHTGLLWAHRGPSSSLVPASQLQRDTASSFKLAMYVYIVIEKTPRRHVGRAHHDHRYHELSSEHWRSYLVLRNRCRYHTRIRAKCRCARTSLMTVVCDVCNMRHGSRTSVRPDAVRKRTSGVSRTDLSSPGFFFFEEIKLQHDDVNGAASFQRQCHWTSFR